MTIREAVAACLHRQAEAVILSTGERVACVCVDCYQPLRADYIAEQRARDERAAYCEHDNLIEITRLNSAGREYICGDCGTWKP